MAYLTDLVSMDAARTKSMSHPFRRDASNPMMGDFNEEQPAQQEQQRVPSSWRGSESSLLGDVEGGVDETRFFSPSSAPFLISPMGMSSRFNFPGVLTEQEAPHTPTLHLSLPAVLTAAAGTTLQCSGTRAQSSSKRKAEACDHHDVDDGEQQEEDDYDDDDEEEEEEEEGLGEERFEDDERPRPQDAEDDDGELTVDEEAVGHTDAGAESLAQRRSKRTPRAPQSQMHDDFDEDEIDNSTDKPRARADLSIKLQELSRRLQLSSKESKNMSPAERKKVRNQGASRISRLKKKIVQLDMEISNESKDRKIGELERENKELRTILERHSLLHLLHAHTHTHEKREERNQTPASVGEQAEAVELAVVPMQATPKRPRGRPRKHPRPEDPAPTITTTATTALAFSTSTPATPGTPSTGATLAAQAMMPPMGFFPADQTSFHALSASPSQPAASTLASSPLAASLASVSTKHAGLSRSISVQNPVCLCHGEAEPNMISCCKCRRPFHRSCIGLNATAHTYRCTKCQ